MKRKIFLSIILILELVFLILIYFEPARNVFISVLPQFENVYDFFIRGVNHVASWIPFSWFTSLDPLLKQWILILLTTVIGIILYLIIFGSIAYFLRRRKQKKLLSKGKEIHLTDEENARYEWKLYERRFPIRRLISLIIPLGIVLIFFFLRYDKTICSLYDNYNVGFFDFYGSMSSSLGGIDHVINQVMSWYININNKIVDRINVTYVEYIEFAVFLILILLLWWGFFSIFAKPFRIYHAKRSASKAKKKYIIAMENKEYKALKKAEKENQSSEKVSELYDLENDTFEEGQIENIASIDKQKEEKVDDNLSQENKAYIDDISTGIVDLGVVEADNDELEKPLISRESHFVGDEEVDINLEEEPMIETLEEEEEYYKSSSNDDNLAFEPYQNDLESLEIEDKVKKYNIDVIDEGEQVIKYGEDQTLVHDFDDNLLDESAKKQSLNEEETTIDKGETIPGATINSKDEFAKWLDSIIVSSIEKATKDLVKEEPKVVEKKEEKTEPSIEDKPKIFVTSKKKAKKKAIKPIGNVSIHDSISSYLLKSEEERKTFTKDELAKEETKEIKEAPKEELLFQNKKNEENIDISSLDIKPLEVKIDSQKEKKIIKPVDPLKITRDR